MSSETFSESINDSGDVSLCRMYRNTMVKINRIKKKFMCGRSRTPFFSDLIHLQLQTVTEQYEHKYIFIYSIINYYVVHK